MAAGGHAQWPVGDVITLMHMHEIILILKGLCKAAKLVHQVRGWLRCAEVSILVIEITPTDRGYKSISITMKAVLAQKNIFQVT